jgi:hypothetical protein
VATGTRLHEVHDVSGLSPQDLDQRVMDIVDSLSLVRAGAM